MIATLVKRSLGSFGGAGQDYNRTEADGANLLARAVGPGGVVMWRAFVYGGGNAYCRSLPCCDVFAIPIASKP
jgi:alpha-glucuronidase